MQMSRFGALSLSTVLLTAALTTGSPPTATVTTVSAASKHGVAARAKATPTRTRAPHATSTPTPTPRATFTARPKATARPTSTPVPTATPIPQVLVVTTTADVAPCPRGSGNPGYSLRCAMGLANSVGSGRAITFNIPSTDPGCHATQVGGNSVPVCTISLTRTLTLAASSTSIDGYTQPGSSPNTSSITGSRDNAVLTIRLDGTSMFAGGIALSNANGDSIQGLALTNFHNGPAIATSTTNDTLIVGNFIGVAPDGTVQGNAEGIRISQAHNTTVGGATPSLRNWVSGNAGFGIAVSQYGLGVTIQGNIISNNGTSGVGVGADAQGASIPAVIRQNLISGNRGLGIDIFPGGVSNCLALVHYASPFTPCPVIRKVTAKAVSGTACKKCMVEIYIASAEADDNGFGEGKTFLGSVVATKGKWKLSLAGKRFNPARQQITATATTQGQTPATSEFALNMPPRFRFHSISARYSVVRGRVTAVRATWQMANQVGVAGFDVYASKRRLNSAMIRAATTAKYSFAARLSGRPRGDMTLAVRLENGVQVKVPLHPTG